MHLSIHASEVMQPFLLSLRGQASLQEDEKSLETGDRRFEFVARHTDKLIFALFQFLTFGDIAHVTLDNVVTIFLVQVAYDLQRPTLTFSGVAHHCLITENMFLLQFS